MRQVTSTALKLALQGLGFSGGLKTAYIERVDLTVRHGAGALARRTLAFSPASSTTLNPPRMVASILSLFTSPCITTSGTREATSTRW